MASESSSARAVPSSSSRRPCSISFQCEFIKFRRQDKQPIDQHTWPHTMQCNFPFCCGWAGLGWDLEFHLGWIVARIIRNKRLNHCYFIIMLLCYVTYARGPLCIVIANIKKLCRLSLCNKISSLLWVECGRGIHKLNICSPFLRLKQLLAINFNCGGVPLQRNIN